MASGTTSVPDFVQIRQLVQKFKGHIDHGDLMNIIYSLTKGKQAKNRLVSVCYSGHAENLIDCKLKRLMTTNGELE